MAPRNPDRNEPTSAFVEYSQVEREYSREAFDRLRYARAVLRVLKPRGLKVALFSGTDRLLVNVSRDWQKVAQKIAVVAIPPDASRAHIALQMARLAGRGDEPYLLDTLLHVRLG